ncbi:hypothetical protein O3P69_014438 [Scylla paramamosain]|uniref:Uncharacterized protein n=1 Tax=Scylla paramamosain TaxID=85552 RepID=A0AAW0TDB6_SCYPA
MEMPVFDNSKVSTEAGLDDALKSSSNSEDDVDVVLASIKTNNNNNNTFDDLLNDKISGIGDSNGKDKGAAAAAAENMFVCDKKESVYDIMDSLVALAPCKGYENSKLMEDMVRFLNGKCEEVEDSIELDDTESIRDDQATCFNSSSELAVNMIMSNPVNLYRVATGLFANLVCLRLKKNILKRIRLLAGTNNKYKVREDNARANFGPKYEPDTTKRWHNRHRIIPPNCLWLDKLENEIHRIACNTTGKKLSLYRSIIKRYGYLSCYLDALNTHNKCYPLVGLHEMFCNNVLAVRRSAFKTHFKSDKFCHSGAGKRPPQQRQAITSMQAGNSENAFEFSKENLELQPSDGMLSNANGRGCLIREYAARIAALPMRINERNKEMARSEHHSLVTIEVFKNRVANFMTYIGELIISPLIAKALEHYNKSDTTTNPGISSVSASKESRMMMRTYAQFCLENKNAAFLMGINKKTFYCIVYTLNRFRFSGSNHKEVNIHQYIFSIKSAVCGDY